MEYPFSCEGERETCEGGHGCNGPSQDSRTSQPRLLHSFVWYSRHRAQGARAKPPSANLISARAPGHTIISPLFCRYHFVAAV